MSVFLFLAAALAQSARQPNPEMPPRDEKGRIGWQEFLKRFSDRKLLLVSGDLIPNRDFGVHRPGEQFQGEWIVAAEGARVGINHKSGPLPTAVMICKTNGSEILIRPDGGCS